MLTKDKAFEVVLRNATDGRESYHEHYNHVTELAEKYKAFATGEGMGQYLKRYNSRETEPEFEQRELLTIYVTKAIWGTANKPKEKVGTVEPLVKVVQYKDGDATKKKDIDNSIGTFYGTEDVDYYLSEIWMRWEELDPNAFILITFDTIDNRFNKPIPYATEISSADAVNYEYSNNILQFLVINRKIDYVTKEATDKKSETTAEGNYYTIYVDNDQISFTQIDLKLNAAANLQIGVIYTKDSREPVEIGSTNKTTTYIVRTSKENLFEVKFFEPKTGYVPAFRVGALRDKSTDGQTTVNLIDNAMPHFEKVTKTGSELDISFSKHAFPQKVSYAPPCPGDIVGGIACINGKTANGIPCAVCGGSGLQLHMSASDAIVIRLPKSPEQAFDLNKLVAYVVVPIDIVKMLDEYVDKEEAKCMRAVYNSNIYEKDSITDTATGRLIDMQSVYDALAPIAARYSFAWKFIVQTIAIYRSIAEGLIIEHKFPKDFKFESVADKLNKLTFAKNGGANQQVMDSMNEDLLQLIYADRPEMLKEAQVKRRFNPFNGKDDTTILSIIQSGETTSYNKTMYLFWSQIFVDAEQTALKPAPIKQADQKEQLVEPTNFYDWSYEKQKALIDTLIKKYQEELQTEKEAAVTTSLKQPAGAGTYSTEDDVISAYNSGELDENGAMNVLTQQFQLSDTEAKNLLAL